MQTVETLLTRNTVGQERFTLSHFVLQLAQSILRVFCSGQK